MTTRIWNSKFTKLGEPLTAGGGTGTTGTWRPGMLDVQNSLHNMDQLQGLMKSPFTSKYDRVMRSTKGVTRPPSVSWKRFNERLGSKEPKVGDVTPWATVALKDLIRSLGTETDPVRVFQNKNMGGYTTSYWCESRNLTCLGGNPLAVEYRRTAAVAIPGTCPSVCTNTGTRHATFALASANGTAAQVRRVTNQLTGSVYAQWERTSTRANGNPMVVPNFNKRYRDEVAKKVATLLLPKTLRSAVRPKVFSKYDYDARLHAKQSIRKALLIIFNGDSPPIIRSGQHATKPDRARKRSGVPTAMVRAIKLMHGLSEWGDAMEAMYNALPMIARCAGKRGIVHDTLCVAAHWDAFLEPEVFSKAVKNLVANHMTDKVIGTLMGSQWRTGVGTFSSSYTTSASVGGGYGAPTVDPSIGEGSGLWTTEDP